MPPKKQPKVSLTQFFAKKQQERNEAAKKPAEIDDSCQILFEKQIPASKPSTSFTKSPNATKWSETLQKTPGNAGKDWLNPFPMQVSTPRRPSDKVSKSDLLANGFDGIHGNELFYPIDEPMRNFELNLLKCASSSNCCIAIPASSPSTSGRLCAMTVFNFLKWFPRCRVLLVGSSESWTTSLRQLGLENQTTTLSTATQFKNMKTEVGRVIACATPQCALKLVESSEASQFIDEIRLVLMDLKSNEFCPKYKPILNALTVKDVFFRCIVLTTSTSNTSRRTSSIVKRQQMITNLTLSDWIEQSESDFAFRSSNIPAGVEVKSWNSDLNSAKLNEIIHNFEKFCKIPIENLARDSIVTSKSMKKLIWTCWKSMKTQNPEFSDKLEIAEFLTNTYKLLVIEGVVAARNFVKKHADRSNLQDLVKKILDVSIFGGFSEFPPKFQILLNAVEAFLKMDNHVLGVVLCRDSEQGAEIQNYLDLQLTTRCTCTRIVEEGTPPARNLWNIQRISTVFIDRKSPKIVILPVKIRDFIGHSDGLPLSEVTFIAAMSRDSLFNFRRFCGAYLLIIHETLEKLRKEDGRLIVDDGKGGQKDSKSAMKVGAVERYDFKYEPSRLRIDVSNVRIRFFYPRSVFDETAEISRMGKTQIEMTSKEHSELFQRLKNPDFTRFQRRKRPFWILEHMENPKKKVPIAVEEMDEMSVLWNQDVQFLGDVKSSKLSERLTKYMKDGPVRWSIQEKRRFEYTNDITSPQHLLHLDLLLRRLDANFEVLSQ